MGKYVTQMKTLSMHIVFKAHTRTTYRLSERKRAYMVRIYKRNKKSDVYK